MTGAPDEDVVGGQQPLRQRVYVLVIADVEGRTRTFMSFNDVLMIATVEDVVNSQSIH